MIEIIQLCFALGTIIINALIVAILQSMSHDIEELTDIIKRGGGRQ